jgi:diguanylate cyclase (GGDEF)-like protein
MKTAETPIVGAIRTSLDGARTMGVPRVKFQGPKLPVRRAGRRDASFGACLVGLLPLVTILTFWVSSPWTQGLASTLAIETGATVLAVLLLRLPWARLPALLLLLYPGILAGSLVAAASLERPLAASYIGLVTVSFIYIGITQSRLIPVLAMAIAIPVYLLCEINVTPAISVRLPIAALIWLLVGEVLADRHARGRAQAKRLAAEASCDGLTGLTSRSGLFAEVSASVERFDEMEGECFLFLLDIDGFKSVNDTFGHPVGDEILCAFSERIREVVRANDMAARLGGDEFAVLVKGANASIASSVGERLLAAAAAPFDLPFGRVIVTASEGIVRVTRSMTASDVIRNADIAMYEAKANGRNRLAFFEPRLQEHIASRVRLGIELYGAIEKAELMLHWQPTINIGTGRTVGMEALVRWEHPTRGLLLPGEFINIAEDTGLVVPLGKFVLDEACRQGAEWQPADLGRQLTISVNVSQRQMIDGNLCRDVKSALAASGLPATALVLEITERSLMVNSPHIRQQLDELKELGIRLAIDDFGTGYSSLAYLRSFPIDIVKIDQSFVSALDEDEQSVALVRSIISIADALGLDTVAEGVESAVQLDTLRRLGCQVAQGHYYSCARRGEDLVGFLGEHELRASHVLG